MAMMAQPSQHEDVLIRRVLQGDIEAFTGLVDCCTPRVYNLAYRLVGNPDDAEDITQEAFLRAFLSIKKFKGDSSFTTWLYRIVVNISYDELKRRRRQPPALTSLQSEDEQPLLETLTSGESPATQWEHIEWQQSIQQALNSLERDYRLVVVLADVQGMSYDEIATTLHWNLGTVKSRLNRARLKLREILSQDRELFCPSSSLNS